MKAILWITIVLAGLAGLAGRFLLAGDSSPAAEREVKPWQRDGDSVAANGVVEGARPEIALRAEVMGRLAALYVRENDEITPETVLGELANDTQKHQVSLAAADLGHAQADLERTRNGARKEQREAAAAVEKARHTLYEHAKTDFDRAQELLSRKSIAREQWDGYHFRMQRTEAEWKQAKAELELVLAPPRYEDVKAAEARVAAADARLKLAEADLAKTRLRSPSHGRVLQVHLEPGEIVGPNTSQPILVVADLSKRRVRAFVEELDVARVKMGQKVTITADGFKGKEYTGAVTVLLPRMGRRAPQSDAPGEYRDVYYREVLIDLHHAEELPTNLRVNVRIRVD